MITESHYGDTHSQLQYFANTEGHSDNDEILIPVSKNTTVVAFSMLLKVLTMTEINPSN